MMCSDDDGLLGSFQIHRRTLFADVGGPEGISPSESVIYADVDVFGWPAHEVTDYLRGEGYDILGEKIVRVDIGLMLVADSSPDIFDIAVWSRRGESNP